MKWHRRLGHPGPERLLSLSRALEDTPTLTPSAVKSITCHPCLVSKSKRSTALQSTRKTTQPLELIHVDVLGPMRSESLSGKKYSIGIMDDFTTKSDVSFMARKSELHENIRSYQLRSERVTGFKIQNIRMDGAG